MEKETSLLFAGLRFDKKSFAADIARFKPKDEEEQRIPPDEEDAPAIVSPAVTGTKNNKKRKRKEKGSEMVEGFNVFKTSNLACKDQEVKILEEDSSEQRKEAEKQIEHVAILRKKFGIHTSGLNVPSPLESFSELRSRYGCKSYLLHNLLERGFKEPTPIQRRAVPVLLSVRECFACAPTGSGKTLAFLFPMLMKVKDLRMASKL